MSMQLSRSKIDLAIARKSYTIRELANDCNVSRQRMYTILNSQKVSPLTASKISQSLGVDVKDIIV